MRLMSRKAAAITAFAIAGVALARYVVERVDPPPYAPVAVPCRTVDASGLPVDCLPVDPSRVGFAALRGL